MSRILLTWELGLNLGHLMRLQPVAQRLRDEGHTVLVAVRNIQAAATVLGPLGIPFVQAPHLPNGIALDHRAAGYADILLSQGWSDRSALWGLTQSWLNLIRLFQPAQLILDYSPTVSLAARIAGLPTALIGNGFELPPLTDPLPAFPGFSWATAQNAAHAERMAVGHANDVLSAFRKPPIAALRDLAAGRPRLVASYPELDHYGARDDVQYIGPLWGKIEGPAVQWPPGDGVKIFACVRRDTSRVTEIMAALAMTRARVVCVTAGFSSAEVARLAADHIRFCVGSVNLKSLLDADLCLTYGAEGTMLRFLLAGVPQLISPWHVETYMAARCIEAAGLGAALNEQKTPQAIAQSIRRASSDSSLRARTRRFAEGRTRDGAADDAPGIALTAAMRGEAGSNEAVRRTAGSKQSELA